MIKRGMVAWAGGGNGPDFFIALADHPEWGRDHTVFGDVESEAELTILEKMLKMPAFKDSGSVRPFRPPVVNLIEPIPIALSSTTY